MKNLLVVTLSNIGDVILTTSVMTSLKAAYPDAYLTVVVGPKAASVLEGSGIIDEIIIYDKRGGWRHYLDLFFKLRKKNYEVVIDLRNTAIPFLVSAKKRSPLFRKFSTLSMRERHLSIMKASGVEPAPQVQFDFFNDADAKKVQAKLNQKGLGFGEDFVLLAPIAASELKTWPFDKFKELIKKILASFSYSIVLVGDNSSRAQSSALSEISPKVINMAGETSLRELAVLIHSAVLLVANDSSVMHFGFEMNRRVVAIYGPTNPERSGRIGKNFRVVREPVPCSPCDQPQCRFERQSCLEDLSADRVFQACQELLSEA